MVCTGFTGTGKADAPLDAMARLGIRATIVFARNLEQPEQIGRLTAALQEALGDELPALIGVDQEGGAVARIRNGVVALPSMMALGATRDPDLARRAGRRLGSDLRAVGINLDFAPVFDLALEPRNAVTGTRSFGEDPSLVSGLGRAFAAGLRQSGVIAVGKHFPGHGATETDSHEALPVVATDAATLRARDLVPFRDAVADAIPALMTAHVLFTSFDSSAPATMSHAILNGLLRTELEFEGVIFSDCVEMAALGGADASVAPRALSAGVDCVVISHRLDLAESAIEAIERAVDDGSLPFERLAEAASRMQALRRTVRPSIGSVEDADIGIRIARKAVKVLRGSVTLQAREPVTIVSFEPADAPSLSSLLRKRGHKSEIMRAPLDPRSEELDLLEMVLTGMPGRRIVIVMRRAHLHPDQAAAIARLLAVAPDAILISAREPYDAALFGEARNLACIYNDTEVSLEGLADVMTARAART